MVSADLQEALADHLFQWGLRPFLSDREYGRWQREQLRPAELHQLQLLADMRHQDPGQSEADLAFYEYAAQPTIYPTLYSQRFDYYLTVGAAMASRIPPAATVLDAGCGLGILTTFYAKQFPDLRIVGIDRSDSSLEVARRQARTMQLRNCSFQAFDLDRGPIADLYEVVLASHVLLQSERDPGIPSDSWHSFARCGHPEAQDAFERRTGVTARLTTLCAALAPTGRLVLCEKARHLARRIGFQRALARRGLRLLEKPLPLRYLSVEDMTEDGPLYVLSRGISEQDAHPWDEHPDTTAEDLVYTCAGPGAEYLYQRLPARTIADRMTFKPPGLASGSIEWGRAGRFGYLYASRHNGFRGLQISPAMSEGLLDSQLTRRLRTMPAGETAAIIEVLQETFGAGPPTGPPADTPLYENHTAGAQQVYEGLSGRVVIEQLDRGQADGKQLHVEHGDAGDLAYVYCANTLDQRQIVMVEHARRNILAGYYRELADGA